MKVLIAYEFSGRVRKAFEDRGHEAHSIDIIDSEIPGDHHIVFDIMEPDTRRWIKKEKFDLLIAHPPCTYTATSGNKWYSNTEERQQGLKDFMYWDKFRFIKKRCIEHPVSIVSTQYRPATQWIQPYEFGDSLQKKTGLWLTNLPPLKPTKIIEPTKFIDDIRGGYKRKLERSKTPIGIAQAMAEQWG